MNLIKTIQDFHYIRASLVVWRINGPSRIKNIDADAGQKLNDLIESKKDDHLPFVIDFKGILTQTDSSLISLFTNIINSKKEIYFINCQSIKQPLRDLYDEFNSDGQADLSDIEDVLILHFTEKLKLKYRYNELRLKINEFLDSEISEIVKGTFIPNDEKKDVFKPLPSTPILATGLFDASIIISNPNYFTWVCIRMADMVDEIIIENTLLNAQLLSVSLRASPFANAISLLLDIPMRTVDHLGPFQKVLDFESFNQYSIPNTNYIFIGDFIVGGTELKLAHLFARYYASDLKYAIVLGDVFGSNRFVHFSISSITKLQGLNDRCKYALFE